MTRELNGIASATLGMKEMPERALGNLKEGVGLGKDGRIVIGRNMDLQKLKPYLGLGHRGLILDKDLLAEFARYESLPATSAVTPGTLPERGVDVPGITEKQCEICQTLGIDGVLRKAAGGNKKLVVNSQGFLAGRDSLGNQWVRSYLGKSGIDVLSFDYFEGNKKVEVSFQKRVEDLMQIITHYSKEGYEVGGHGSSVGGSALWVASSLLSKQGTQLKAIANRSIIPNLLESFVKRERISVEFVRENVAQVSQRINSENNAEGQIKWSPDELKEVCEGKFDLDRYADISCPMLDIQGSEDTVAGMNLVRDVMRQLKKFNANSQLVEIAGATHGVENPKDVIMQMYLVVSFLKKHMLNGKS
ncbi:MAG: hypothetical protein A3C07_04760 [Candidatus Sungbacteria bacterium RIFCSPHIGHO2_02_FULL_47_11]|uniref:Peptidase S9 prolyl oligopeptidase catalytic domain-containing protein n=1 Tax=Candidatus Sungbacteria bacterium RIFCSPHIGHO2_02_FULL_47_11 TaxID=1802270 RepID=A0A1G2KN69_9BACT|nr:MAG: hypothetical protein A3C07_04760 [Candidatus Sungbacteria bacterium RIFCSPHIGHO2_02_FULL_47_11]